MTKRVIEREQSIMGTIFFIFKVNTVEKVLGPFPITGGLKGIDSEPQKTPYVYVKYHHKFIPGTRECISSL